MTTTLTAASMRDVATSADDMTTFDFRSPGKMAREQVRSLEVAHETFARLWGSVLTNTLRSLVHLELIGVQQLTFEEYVRSMPNPVVLGMVGLSPLPGNALIELDVPMGLTMVDRMLGGLGKPIGVRRPTELEATLLHELLERGAYSMAEAFDSFLEVEPELSGVEFNPHLVQTISPSEMVVVLVYSVAVAHGGRSDGIATVAYPFSTLQPAADRIGRAGWQDHAPLSDSEESATPLLREHLIDVDVPLTVELQPSSLSTSEVAGLERGDVLTLDHPLDEPVRVLLGGAELMRARLGRRGKRRAIQIIDWREQ